MLEPCPLQGHRELPVVYPARLRGAPPGQPAVHPAQERPWQERGGQRVQALVGLYWLEGSFQLLTNLFLTLMDLDQIEYANWTPAERRSSVGYLRGDNAIRCTKFAFTHEGRDYGYKNGGPAPTLGSVVIKRPPRLAKPGTILWIHEWNPHFRGSVPQGEHHAPPTPSAAPGGDMPRGNATNGRAAPTGPPPAGSSNDQPAQGGTHEEAGRAPGDEEAEQEADRRRRTQHPFDTKHKDTIALCFNKGHAEPQPYPDKCTVIYEISPLGETTLHRVVPRSRWPRDRGCIEDF